MSIRAAQRQDIRGVAFLIFLMVGLGLLTVWALSNGFIYNSAAERWARVVAALGAKEFLLEHLTFLTPHLPLYVLIPFYYIPGLNSSSAPYFASLLAAFGLLLLWGVHLKDVDMSARRLALVAVLIVVHPGFLWGATSGGQLSMSMLAFYLLYRASQYIISDHDIHSYISLAVIFLFFFFIDGSAVFIFVALIPLLVVIAPLRAVMVSPMSLFLIVGTPFVMAVGTWAYLNWIFEGSFLHFITDADSAFLGGMGKIEQFPWLVAHGGEFFESVLAATGYLLAAYPVSVYLLLDTIDNNYRFRATFVLLLHPLIAIGIATSQYYLTHPMDILTLVSAGLMAELTYVRMQTRREFGFLVFFMVMSVAGGWWVFIETATPQMHQWVKSLSGEVRMDDASRSDLLLGLWLDKHRLPTLMHEQSGYRVIAARGDAKGMALSFSRQFKSALRQRIPDVAQIVVPDPETVHGKRDMLNVRHPHLYEHGLKGFHRVYDRLGWRVYRKNNV